MCKIVHYHGFQLPKLRVHPAPEVHDFAIRCMHFLSHLICHIKHGADILARQMDFRALYPMCASKNSLNSNTGFIRDCYLTTNSK